MTTSTQPRVETVTLPTPAMTYTHSIESVFAEGVRAVMGGLGAGLVAAVITYWLGGGWWWIAAVGTSATLLFCGALAMMFSAEDRMRNLYVLRQWEDALGDKQAECDYLRTVISERNKKIERLSDDLDDAENRIEAGNYHSAVAAAGNNPKSVVIRNTFTDANKQDAVAMLERWYLQNKYPSESEMGWPRTRWEPAHRLLRRVGLVRLKHRTPQPRQRNITWAIDRLNAHFGNLKGQPVSDPIDGDGDDDTDTSPA
jgi:hypothetical protein